ncbi:alanine racemase [Pseudomonadota bacterium]
MTETSPLNSPEARRAGAILTIDLAALANNWRVYADMARDNGAEAACVVKAQSYGLDAAHVAPALFRAGCKTFYVATIDEGIELRSILGSSVTIHVFNGLMDGAERDFTEHYLVPVLNALGEVDAWRAFCTGYGQPLACDIHVDTGMARLGLPDDELNQVIDNPDHLSGLKLDTILSHLAVAEETNHPKNAAQLAKFKAALAHMPKARASLANSSGAFLGADYHFDQVRPGAALYGVNPTPDQPNPMAQVVRLQGKILQVRAIDTPHSVGYGATYRPQGEARIATIAAGYADGYHRSLSNAGTVYIGEHKASVVGRVSMDLITVDVTHVPEELTRPGQLVDLIGPNNPVDQVGADANTIGYEILTGLGARYHRIYVGGET